MRCCSWQGRERAGAGADVALPWCAPQQAHQKVEGAAPSGANAHLHALAALYVNVTTECVSMVSVAFLALCQNSIDPHVQGPGLLTLSRQSCLRVAGCTLQSTSNVVRG